MVDIEVFGVCDMESHYVRLEAALGPNRLQLLLLMNSYIV